jgi:hypothetical protein
MRYDDLIWLGVLRVASVPEEVGLVLAIRMKDRAMLPDSSCLNDCAVLT